jgi:hypothetical protein
MRNWIAMDPALAFRGSVRASDADRNRAVASLRRHYAAGRLETHELEERVELAYQARWRSELRTLLRDLPLELPTVDRGRIAGRVDSFQRGVLHLHAICWAIFNTVLIAIWAWGGGHGFWPLVALLPTTLLLLWHTRGSRALTRRLGSPPERDTRALPKRRLLA